MKKSVRVRNLRSKAIETIAAARQEVASTARKVEAIRRSTFLTEEGKAKDIGAWVKQTRDKLSKEIAAVQRDTRAKKEAAEGKLEELRHVPADELSAAAQVLAPVIAAANQNPDALISAYAKRHKNLADRRLLEETAQAMIDAGLGGMAFGEKWQRAQMNAEIPEEEREAAAEAEHLGEIGDYLNSAAAVMGVDLVELERPPGIREVMTRETARAGVHRFENSADTGDASGNAA